MKKLLRKFSTGMTLVEIMIVLTVLLVLFGAVFLFFTRGSEEFDFSRRQNELITIGRLALEEVTDIILYAGYMPKAAWGNDEWHPVVIADSSEFEFYADWDANELLEAIDYRKVEVANNQFVVTDRDDYVKRIGSNIYSIDFNYLDELGNPLPEPLSEYDRDLVRHIQIELTMADEYRGQMYYTEVATTISPRNLGVNHNIDPAFAPPDPLEGTVVFNVCGVDTVPLPNEDELLQINRMIDWGLTVIPLTDYQMGIFDFRGEDIDLILLRHRGPLDVFPHPDLFNNYSANKDTLYIPVVTMNAKDAMDIFDMGHKVDERLMTWMDPRWAHPVNRDLPSDLGPFEVYVTGSTATQSILDSLNYSMLDDSVLTMPATLMTSFAGMSGITVCYEDFGKRRVHFSAWDASEYTSGGWQIFYNVVKWNVGDNSGELGDVIEEEDFENPLDYSYVNPGYGEDSYCYVVSPWTYIPDDSSKADYEAVLRFSHCYWTRNRNAGGYIDIDTTWVDTTHTVWNHIPDGLLTEGYYHQLTASGFPGGAGLEAYMFKSPGYSPSGPTLTREEVDLEDYRGKHVRFRWVFGVEEKESNNQDGWIVDDMTILLLDRDTTALDSIVLDPWTLNPYNLVIQPRFWEHHEFPGYNDDWFYHHLYNVDPIYPFEQGYAWTTWGSIGYIGPWVHGGSHDSWEIGVTVAPEFTPLVDPMATPYNGSHYAGQDLTYDDGKYNFFETSYLLSERWEVANTDPYDVITLEIYRCIRNANDIGWIHVGFSTDTLPPDPMDLTQWYSKVPIEPWVRMYEVNHANWEYEAIELTDVFDEALADSAYLYYWVLFSHSSGPALNAGGWNLDNIRVYGKNVF